MLVSKPVICFHSQYRYIVATMPTGFEPSADDIERQLQEHPDEAVAITSSKTGRVYYVSNQPVPMLDAEILQAIKQGLDDVKAGRLHDAKPFVESLGSDDCCSQSRLRPTFTRHLRQFTTRTLTQQDGGNANFLV